MLETKGAGDNGSGPSHIYTQRCLQESKIILGNWVHTPGIRFIVPVSTFNVMFCLNSSHHVQSPWSDETVDRKFKLVKIT